MQPVKSKCRKCGREANSTEFILDPVYKMMVCKECVKERRMSELAASKAKHQAEKSAKQAEEKKKMPAGWDYEDAEIERAYKEKQGKQIQVERIDAESVKYTCPKCKFDFVYNVVERRPARCGYCGAVVQYN